MRVLVTGGSGGLGRYVSRALFARDATVMAPQHEDLDITRLDDLRAYVESVKPTAVVHLAAIANVDRCAERPEEAVAVNGVATYRLASICRRFKVPLVYMSTNDVFSECRDGPFSESRAPAPGMAYSWSKYLGEVAVVEAGGLAVRANFFTRHCRAKQSFAAYVLECARGDRPLLCHSNVLATPVYAGTLAERLVEALCAEVTGVLHVASSDAVNRAQQARLICAAYGLPAEKVTPRPLEDRRGRPLDARLTSERGGLAGTVQEEVMKMAKEEPL
mgnify:CR=1 FL=1